MKVAVHEPAAVVRLASRQCILIVTTKRCRAVSPKRCNTKSFHVWRWFGGPKAPSGTRCQCGLLDQPPIVPDSDER